MPTITPLHPDQAAEAHRVIYTVAHALWRSHETLDESIAYYQSSWPIPDVDNFEEVYCRPGGAFFAACTEDGKIIGTGALKFLEPGVGEIKRVWLLPEYHGQGLGYQMMQRLIAAARELGYTTLRLETSPAYQPRAYAFYHRLGFYDIPRYGDDPDDIGMELLV